VRGCMLTYTGLAVTDFPEEDFPVPRTVYRPFHLDASAGKLLDTAPTKKGEITYPSDEFAGKACFTFTADRRIDIFGMIKVKFWTSYDTGADADYHCIIRKLDTRGKTLRHNNIPYKDLPLNVQSDYDLLEFSVAVHNGPNAHLRASYRATDTSRAASPGEVFHPFDKPSPVKPGTPFEMEMGFWPSGMRVEAGESIRLEISGCDAALRRFLKSKINDGNHTVYTGPHYPAVLTLPII